MPRKKITPEQEPISEGMELGIDTEQMNPEAAGEQAGIGPCPPGESDAFELSSVPEGAPEEEAETFEPQPALEPESDGLPDGPPSPGEPGTGLEGDGLGSAPLSDLEAAEASAFSEGESESGQGDDLSQPGEELTERESGVPLEDEPLTQSDSSEGETPPEPQEEPPASAERSQKLRMPRQRRDARIVSIDAERSVETDTDRLRSDLLDLVESMKGKKILTDMVQGVERPSPDSELSYAVVYHGSFKVIIPVLEMVEEPEDYRGQPKGDVLHYLLNKRLGAEIDYIVKGVDQETGVAAASRLEAMAKKRKEYYFRTDTGGNYQIYEGIRAEARVISVIRAGIFIDLFGAETYIPLKELSYQRWVDAGVHYQPGQRVLVKVLEVDRSDRNRPRVSASVKQASENPYEKALQKYSVGSRYVGTVSLVDLNGVFVSLDGGIDCLCSYPPRGRPPRGSRVTVRILGINRENNRIWGAITHMTTTR